MPIHVLPEDVAAKIAAGEVVERPASVAKELVENSLDAGATDIKVEVRDGGQRLIRVIDNGHGIPQDEVEIAFERHATSKLETAEDLERIRTLGFRGEALPSIAAVSQVTLLTRADGEDVGTLLRLEGGKIVDRQPRGAAGGTVITMENLFYNTPARRKFLRTARTESGHIQTYITRVAMAFPDRRFTLTNNGRTNFQSTGSGELLDVLIEIYGLDTAQQLLQIDEPAEEPGSQGAGEQGSTGAREHPSTHAPQHPCTVSGYVSPPALHRSNRTYIDLFVNGRWIQDRSLTYAVGEAYRTLLPKGRHPIAVIRISIDPSEVDVNVHPAKTEVRFRDGRKVFAAVQRAVRATVIDQAPVPRIESPTHHAGFSDWEQTRTPRDHVDNQLAMGLQRTADVEPAAGTERDSADKLPPLRVVGQIAQAYIIAEGPSGMFLIDQHAAHERVLYEQLMNAAQGGNESPTASQALLDPLTVDLTGPQLETLEAYLDGLGDMGFEIKPFGGETVLIRAVPELLKGRNPAQAMISIVDELATGGSLVDEEREQRIITSVCKQGAVRAGQTLSHAEMQALIRDLEASISPRTCPHGRPTMIHLSAAQLEREFGRR
ncbi:MAG: DNA mismatch repair protein MutL [Anaerolineales bacterium]|nr:DNA mismatch repair protein MutL [Anaerolineales bacterium]